jgi:hypothetical protein
MDSRTGLRVARYAVAASLLALVAACTVPVDYERETGLDVNVAVEGDVEPLLSGLRAGPWAVASLEVGAMAGPYREVRALLLGADRAQARQLRQVDGVNSLTIVPHSEKASGTLAEMVADRFFRVELDVAGKSDQEINAALDQLLAAQGFDGEVSVTRDAEGRIQVSMGEMAHDHEGRTELFIGLVDGDEGVEQERVVEHQGALRQMELGDIEGLTPEQIREKVQRQLADLGLDSGASQVQVMVVGEHEGGVIEKKIEVRVERDAVDTEQAPK